MQLAERPNALLTNDDVGCFPDLFVAQLKSLGLLVSRQHASHVECDACYEGHVEPVTRVQRSKEKCEFRIACPDAGWVIVPEFRLFQWAIDHSVLAQILAKALIASGSITEVIPGCMWKLGKVNWQSRKREALFVQGFHGDDTPELVRELQKRKSAMVFVPDSIPDSSLWSSNYPCLLRLTDFATLTETGLDVDLTGLASLVAVADAACAEFAQERLDRQSLQKLVQREVRSANKAELTNDLLRAAVAETGSARKAAKRLKERGMSIHHSNISRRLENDGGAPIRGESSDSVKRSVASQRRNGQKKIHNLTETVDYERDREE
jgi:hypothetical protein